MKSTPEYVRILKNYMTQNAVKYGIIRMGIFGSVARGEQKLLHREVDLVEEGQLKDFAQSSAEQDKILIYDRAA